MLHNSEVQLLYGVNVRENLLDGIGDLRSGEGEVPKSPSEALVDCHVANWGEASSSETIS